MDCLFKLPSYFGFQGVPHHQLPPQYQKIVERLKVVEQEISGGAMAIVAVVLNNKLYIANVGELYFCQQLSLGVLEDGCGSRKRKKFECGGQFLSSVAKEGYGCYLQEHLK